MEHLGRIKKLQQSLGDLGFHAAVLQYSRDIFYYTGTAQPSWFAVSPEQYTLYVRSGYETAVNEASVEKSRIKQARKLDAIYGEMFPRLHPEPRKIGLETDVLTHDQWKQYAKAFPGCEFENISPLILEQRKRKEPGEIGLIREACRALHYGHGALVENLREGMTELELSACVENAHRLAGHEGIFFIRIPDFFMSRGPISSGENLFRNTGVVYSITGVGLSPSVPAGPSLKRISRGDLIVCDIPTHVQGYHGDQSRTYCLGDAGPQARAMHKDLEAIADHLIEKIRPGIKCSEIYRLAFEKAAALGRADTFQSFGPGRRSRLIGHGIGIELNEPPIPSEYDDSPVDENFVLALDIHMMDEKVGVVKLEDMILVKNNGNEILTITPRQLFEI